MQFWASDVPLESFPFYAVKWETELRYHGEMEVALKWRPLTTLSVDRTSVELEKETLKLDDPMKMNLVTSSLQCTNINSQKFKLSTMKKQMLFVAMRLTDTGDQSGIPKTIA